MDYNCEHCSTDQGFARGFKKAMDVYNAMPWWDRLFGKALGETFVNERGWQSVTKWWEK